jgi:WD40 repeat protein
VVRGQKFGNYELLEKIGEGGMGVVYKARQINLDRLVALKLLPFGQFSRVDLVKRFRAEATAAASLHHPNIVAIYDVGEHEGQHYFSMELVGGQTLGELVRDQPLPAKRAAAYLKTIAEAVHYAHQHGILHRDLKPSNVIIDASDQPRITDFGLAKRLDDHQLSTIDHPLTLTGQVLGSPNFMAPEQAGGHAKAIGPPSDVYSLGALLYHLLTRQPPFQADTLTTLLKQVVEAEPVPPHLLNPNIPRDLETICLKCLEKEVPRRYSTARELAEELDRFLEDKPIRARPASAVGKAWKWCRRRPALAGVTAALVLTFVVGFGGALWEWRRAAHNEQFARHNAYAADMHLAQLAIGENNRRLAITLLDKYRPQGKSETRNPKPEGRPKSGTDLRGWEWRYLWQLCRGDEPSLLHRYPQAVKALAVSRDGKMLAVATGGEVALWDVATWQPLTTLSVRDPQSLAFSPTDNLLAVGTWNTNGQPVVELWEIDADVPRKKLARLAGNHSLAFSPDGKRLAILGDGGTLTIADCASGQTNQFRVQPLRYGPAGAIVFLADADHLAVGEEYGRLELRDPNTGAFTPSLDTHTGACVTALAFSPAAGLLAAGFGYGNGTIQLWDVRSRELRGQLTNHTDDVTGLAFSADGRTLASASSDWTIRLWSVTEQSQLRCLHTAREGLTALALLSDNLTLVSGGSGGSVCLWGTNSASQRLIHTNLAVCLGLESMRDVPPEGWESETLDPRTARRFGLAFTPDSGSFITLDSGGTLMRWDARSWQPVETLRALGSNHWGVALSPDGHWLATGDHPDKITLYDWTTRRVVTNFTVPFEWFGLFRFSRSGRYFIGHAARNNATHCFRIWRTGDWAEVPLTGSQFANLYPVDLSPDDRLLAAGYRNGALKLYRFPSLESVATLAQDGDMVCGVVFTPDGRELVSVDAAGRVRHWDVATGRELGEPLSGHLGIIMGAAFSPDGRRLATGGPTARDAVKLWDLEARREILTLPAEGFYFTHLVFSPDGSTLAATSLHGITHLWRAPPWEDIETAEKGKGSP